MKTLSLGIVLLAAAALPGRAALHEGDAAPAFAAPAALDGKPFQYSLAEALTSGPVVVYFYPSAFTKGCNLQAHTFANRLERFRAAGASIIGVSLDDVGRLVAFSSDPDYCAGKIPVASDLDGSIARAFALEVRTLPEARKDTRGAAITHGLAERTTFVVKPDGHIVASLEGLAPVENVERALAVVEQLALHPH